MICVGFSADDRSARREFSGAGKNGQGRQMQAGNGNALCSGWVIRVQSFI
jgi:hypothetical protein